VQKFPIRSFKFLGNNSGQSLIEILIAATIGVLMITAAAGIIAPVLKVSTQTGKAQTGVALAKELLDNVKVWAEGDWHNVSALATSSANKYFLDAAASPFVVATGTESVLADGIVSGLVGYWKFDEATGTVAYDFSGNNNLGTWYGTGNHHSSGKLGYAGQLNGSSTSDYVSFPANNDINLKGNLYTYVAWVNLRSIGPNNYAELFSVTGGNRTGIKLNGPSWHTIGVDFNSDFYSYTVNIPSWNFNTWNHLAVIIDRTNCYFTAYWNGAYQGTSTVFTSYTPTATNSTVGRNGLTGNQGDYTDGFLDDVRLYNRALSASEISAIYKASVFSRYFYVDDVYRSGDNISVSGVVDPSTKQVTVAYNWPQGVTSTLYEYITRSGSRVFDQTDWSGGQGQDGPVTSTNSKFATSSLIDNTTTTGSIYVKF
jgi:hypothetical protein